MTDFEQYGFSEGRVAVKKPYWLITVDFEAFASSNLSIWLEAMRYWAARSTRYGFRFCFFMSMEDISNLRHKTREGYRDFLEGIRLLHDSGTRFYTHNHCLYDPETGALLGTPDGERPEGYSKRLSLFYRTNYLQKIDFADWMLTVRKDYEGFLLDAGLPRPAALAFRAGGWDYGSTREDLKTYIDALDAAGYAIDSSACSGVFGTPSWKMGSDYGENVFLLRPHMVEIAASYSIDCGVPQKGRQSPMMRLGSAPGVYMDVLHFDHLFHSRDNGTRVCFGITEPEVVRKRIDEFFRVLGYWWSLAPRQMATFEDIEFASQEETADLNAVAACL